MDTTIMKIVKLDNKGRGITYLNKKICFVNNALEGEEVILKNIKEYSKYYEADVSEYVKKSIKRVKSKCIYYDICGGCNLMHINLNSQENYKKNKLNEVLKKYADIEVKNKFINNNSELFYRNKVTLKINNYEWGYYSYMTHDFIKVDKCLIINNCINDLIDKKELFNIKSGEVIIRSNRDQELLVIFNIDEKYDVNIKDIPDNIRGIIVNDKCIYGDDYFYDYIGDYKFKLSYNSFFQVNNYMAANIFDILNNNLKGNTLLDLYCGVGTLGISLKKKFKSIYGIEKIENAILNARENADMNGLREYHYYVGDTTKVLKNINVSFDCVIVDPPRSGLSEETLKQVIKINPKQLAYISCDPITLARDLKKLVKYYDIKKINGLDMFPNTYHVETVCILERK